MARSCKGSVLYNGLAPCPDEQTIRLSDSFEMLDSLGLSDKLDLSLELVVRVLNINEGRNADIAKRCKSLAGYSAFVAKERAFAQELGDKEAAMRATIAYCLENDILKEFLEKHSEEVMNMRITEWNTEEAIAVWREEGHEEGFEKGIEKGRTENALATARKLKEMGLSAEQIAEATGLDVEALQQNA